MTVEEKHIKIYGPRAEFGWVRMTGEPSAVFGYRSQVEWPEESGRFEAAVLDGILDELLAAGPGMVALNASFTLEAIKWHPVDSVPQAFYWAARAAARSILAPCELPGNVVPVKP